MTIGRGRVRFALEGVFVAGVAALVTLLKLDWIAIGLIMAGALLLAIGLDRWTAERERRGDSLLPQRSRREPEPVPAPAGTVAEPEEVEEPELEPEQGVVAGAADSAGPREWNVWELDRLARDGAGIDPALDEERALLLLHLREFAGPDGLLPASFDDLVREVFGELVVVGGRT